ncbi:exported hypothetical protein [Candidatus Sulfotelmatomonas gaucii]|uniref:Uncharacterized protein n=1 Tax=Candidatus Sulfuritelmatomonas gaucii TaxID=2043161 RepID=A0A2N9LWN9_9BACT|nr:exported hypothetical protein [Candidatus Sulfotelmatomonas gaucii]
MNWKWVLVGILGVLLGLLIAPFEHKRVLASAAPVSTHFQIQAATVDESDGQGQRVPSHEVFLLDTESGEVWQFQGPVTAFNQTKGEAAFIPPKFFRVAVQ